MKKSKIKKLKSKFTTSAGYDVTLIKRKGRIAWYEARYVNGEDLQGYIVAKIKNRAESTLPNGTVIPAFEQFPPASEFGTYGWFYMKNSRQRSGRHFDVLVAKDEQLPSSRAKTAK